MEYLNEKVWATVGVSNIQGIGVIAIRDIPKGTVITDYNSMDDDWDVPLIFSIEWDEFEKILPEIRNVILNQVYFPKGMPLAQFVNPNHVQCLQSFMNHSEDANTDGRVALREIKKGEELTENYRLLYVEGLHELSVKNSGFL